MWVLVSMRGQMFGPGLAELLEVDPRVSQVDIASDLDSVLGALLERRYDLHVVGVACLDIALEIGRRNKSESLALCDPDERVLVAVDPDASAVLEAGRLGFARIMGPTADLMDRLLTPAGSDLWWEDHVENFPVGPGSGVRLGEICHDEIDRRIITLIIEGWSDAEIADKMSYAVQSVRNRVSRMLQVSGFRNRTELAVKMVRRVQRL